MADVLGLVAGVVSLGLQVSQGLISYYRDFRGQEEEINSLSTRLETLKETLLVIEVLLASDQRLGLQSADLVKSSVISTLGGIARLQTFLKKCRQNATQDSGTSTLAGAAGPSERPNQDVASRQVKKLLSKVAYPFRKSTLTGLNDTVAELQANLNIAINALHLLVELLGNFLIIASDIRI
jgi:uncharacterized coiled-coil protein SlyX